jgi:hypothetical protein
MQGQSIIAWRYQRAKGASVLHRCAGDKEIGLVWEADPNQRAPGALRAVLKGGREFTRAFQRPGPGDGRLGVLDELVVQGNLYFVVGEGKVNNVSEIS